MISVARFVADLDQAGSDCSNLDLPCFADYPCEAGSSPVF